MALFLFWSSALLILLTYVGFPLVLAARAARKRKEVLRYSSDETLPTIGVVVAAHNEEQWILRKLDNIFSLIYPSEKMEVIIASDGSTDATNELVSSYESSKVRLLVLPRQGKNATLNDAVSQCNSEIVVFTDADALMKEDALLHLIGPFKDPSIGAVGGDYRYGGQKTNGNEESTYWKYDRLLKRLQSASGSMTSATGQIYAIRRELFRPIPEKLVDDFYVSVGARSAGHRLLFEPRAIAFGPIADAGKAEFDRKVRVITGGLRTVWRVRYLLNPFRYGSYAFQLLTHKVLRRLLAIPLILLAISSLLLWQQGWVYQAAASSQILLHVLAAVGFLFRNTAIGRKKIFSLPFFFDLVNLACLAALQNLLTGTRHDIWKPMRTTATANMLEIER